MSTKLKTQKAAIDYYKGEGDERSERERREIRQVKGC